MKSTYCYITPELKAKMDDFIEWMMVDAQITKDPNVLAALSAILPAYLERFFYEGSSPIRKDT